VHTSNVMIAKRGASMVLALTISVTVAAMGQQAAAARPVTPNASPEAVALLGYIQGLSGRHLLSGQHNYPNSGDRNTRYAADYIGETPVVWSQDFGFAAEGDKDSYLARPAIIREAIRQHRKGAIVTLCWHAVPPTADEPITFQPLAGADSTALASVQGRLLDRQFRDILTPGTALNRHWRRQVDAIASFLKQLQDAHVPVLWRPYHEMNGDWFWWGGRHQGEYTTRALYRQLFDYLVVHHGLNNLIWVWSVDRPTRPDRAFDLYYPGSDYLDVLALDVYGNDFNQSYYDGLLRLSQGKPIALGEVGNPPALEILAAQPNWTWWVVWAGMVGYTSRSDWEKQAADPRVLFLEDQAYLEGTRAYRAALGLAPLAIDRAADYSGTWRLNRYESDVRSPWVTEVPYRLDVVQTGAALHVRATAIVEWADDEVTEWTLTLDGGEDATADSRPGSRLAHAHLSVGRDTLTIETRISPPSGGPAEAQSREVWTLRRHGRQLVVVKTVALSREPVTSSLVYDRQP
jgi:mannan endo-1,4-beta-mannosidase